MLLKYLIPGKGDYSFVNRLLQRIMSHHKINLLLLIYFRKQKLEFCENIVEINININKYSIVQIIETVSALLLKVLSRYFARKKKKRYWR